MMIRSIACALAFTLAALSPTLTQAHAVLLKTTPADGITLEVPPAELRLVFSEPVRPIFLRLIASDGRQRLSADAARAQNATIAAAVPTLPEGAYVVSWRAVSTDGHPIGGAFTFRVGTATDATSDVMLPTETGWLATSGAVRFLVLGLTVLTAGGALFIATVFRGGPAPAAIRRYVLLSAIGAAAALILSLGIEGGLVMLGHWSAILDPGVWAVGASGTKGASVALSLMGLSLIGAGLFHRRRTRPWLVSLGAIIAVAGFGLSGHAATAAPRWLTTPAVIAHGLAAAFWIGALWPLIWFLRHGSTPAAGTVIRRFSQVAVGAVALLVLAGTALATVQLGSVAALWQSAYGFILLAKLGAVLVLLGLAAWNKWRLTPTLGHKGTPGGNALRRSIHAEIALAIGILAATAALGTVPPPRALVAQTAGAAQDHGQLATERDYRISVAAPPYTAMLEVAPARPGINTITMRLLGDDRGAPVEPLQATLALSLPAAGIEPITRKLEPFGPGRFRFTGSVLSLPGRWTLRVEVLITDFEKVVFETEIPIPVAGS